MAIQIRRGTDSQWESNKSNIVAGEPAITTDTGRFFVGTGTGTYEEYVKKSTLADYVVEQGTSGIWTYRKWDSGVSECWGIEITHKSVAGNKQINDIYLPDIFISAPIPQVTQGTAGTINSWLKYVEIPSGKKNGFYFFDIYVYSEHGDKDIFLSLVARGRWK